MATLSHIPSPAAVSVKTAGYTIPVGRYSRCIVNLEGSATFTIDAVTALRGTQNNVLGSSPLSSIPFSAVINAGGAQANRGSLMTGNTATTGNPDVTDADAFATATDQKTVVQDYFLPTGTVINGTGTFRVVVEEYLGA